MNLDYLVVSDLFMTPTASFADIVLPVATQFEFNDIGHWGMGHGFILARPKVVDPPEECWPDIKILNELGKALTSSEYWYEDYEALLEEVVKPSGLRYKEFAVKGYLEGEHRFKKYVPSGFKTSSGKVELVLSQAEKFRLSSLPRFVGPLEESDPDYPLVLTSSKSRYFLHSSYRWLERLRKQRPHPKTEMHPETAAAYGIQEGDEVVIETKTGKITQVAHLTEKVHPKVINAAYGWWFPEGTAESQYDWKKSNFNILTSMEKLGKEFGTPNLKGIGCKISKK
jgi:anaerobic selenocysteine-containing dehydrogenase